MASVTESIKQYSTAQFQDQLSIYNRYSAITVIPIPAGAAAQPELYVEIHLMCYLFSLLSLRVWPQFLYFTSPVYYAPYRETCYYLQCHFSQCIARAKPLAGSSKLA